MHQEKESQAPAHAAPASDLAALRKEVRQLRRDVRRLTDLPAAVLRWAETIRAVQGLAAPPTPSPEQQAVPFRNGADAEALSVWKMFSAREQDILRVLADGETRPAKKIAALAKYDHTTTFDITLGNLCEREILVSSHRGYALRPGGPAAEPARPPVAQERPAPAPQDRGEEPFRRPKLSDLEERAKNGQPLFTPRNGTD